MIPWWMGVAALFIGTACGAFLLGLLNMRGPSAQDALWHLERLYWLVDQGGAIAIRDSGGTRIIDNARRFLLQWGEGEGS